MRITLLLPLLLVVVATLITAFPKPFPAKQEVAINQGKWVHDILFENATCLSKNYSNSYLGSNGGNGGKQQKDTQTGTAKMFYCGFIKLNSKHDEIHFYS
jgi:hypothetical protein